jgi:hypothetical protein
MNRAAKVDRLLLELIEVEEVIVIGKEASSKSSVYPAYTSTKKSYSHHRLKYPARLRRLAQGVYHDRENGRVLNRITVRPL